MVPVGAPVLKRGVLERGTAKLYLLELDRKVILSNVPVEPSEFYERRIPTGLLDPLYASHAASGSISRRTRIPARASMTISLSMLKRPISPFSKLLIRGCVSPKKSAASVCVHPRV